MSERTNVIAAKRQRDEEAARAAEEQRAREEEERQEAERAKLAQEVERLRAAEFVLVHQINNRNLWRHDEHPDTHFWQSEAIALLNAAEQEAAAE